MKIWKTALGAIGVVGGAVVTVVGGTLDVVCQVIGANAPGQSFSEWEESQKSLENLGSGDMLLMDAGISLVTKSVELFKEGIE